MDLDQVVADVRDRLALELEGRLADAGIDARTEDEGIDGILVILSHASHAERLGKLAGPPWISETSASGTRHPLRVAPKVVDRVRALATRMTVSYVRARLRAVGLTDAKVEAQQARVSVELPRGTEGAGWSRGNVAPRGCHRVRPDARGAARGAATVRV